MRLESISKAMLAECPPREAATKKARIAIKNEEELAAFVAFLKRRNSYSEIENKRALSERKAEELKRALENGRKQSTWLEKLVSVKTESIRTETRSVGEKTTRLG